LPTDPLCALPSSHKHPPVPPLEKTTPQPSLLVGKNLYFAFSFNRLCLQRKHHHLFAELDGKQLRSWAFHPFHGFFRSSRLRGGKAFFHPRRQYGAASTQLWRGRLQKRRARAWALCQHRRVRGRGRSPKLSHGTAPCPSHLNPHTGPGVDRWQHY